MGEEALNLGPLVLDGLRQEAPVDRAVDGVGVASMISAARAAVSPFIRCCRGIVNGRTAGCSLSPVAGQEIANRGAMRPGMTTARTRVDGGGPASRTVPSRGPG